MLKIREGYFLLRAIVKTAKDEDTQERIIDLISNKFHKIIIGDNGSLLCQCIIYNFPLSHYYHNKTCSKYLEEDNYNKEKKEEVKKLAYDENNKPTKMLIKLVFSSIDYWDEKQFKPLLECGIKVSKSIFEKRFVKSLKNTDEKANPVYKLMTLDEGADILSLIFNHFNEKNWVKVVNLIQGYLSLFDKKERKKWQNLLKEQWGINYTKEDEKYNLVHKKINLIILIDMIILLILLLTNMLILIC